MEQRDRDESGKFVKGNPGGPGRPVFSIVSIIKDELQRVPDGSDEPVIRSMVREYIADARERNDGVAVRDIIDRFDGKPKQHVAVEDERDDPWHDLVRDMWIDAKQVSEDDSEALQGDEAEATDT